MMNKKNCTGCRDDFYNGNNEIGVKECWKLKDAKLITRYAIEWWMPMDSINNFTKVTKPNCYHQPGKIAYLNEIPKHLK